MHLRIFPLIIGSVLAYTTSAATHHPQEFLKNISGSKNEGEQIVQHFCSNCHAEQPMIVIGAPRMNQKEDWEPRIKNGVSVVMQHTIEGVGAMPPRGGCFECSDQQLILAIIAMLPKEFKESFSTALEKSNSK
ncbi:cytochrome c5 family protein [Legionella jordanis]|uniref:c-type cytochrome n=1 Tax=Legionella jordanis TaxID=456 RepID=UPI000EFECEDD|nr:c-type cytochrome [Legionella jordanis]RMX18738.1 cytochrome c5 family protein [Legionella jordanis]